MEENTTEATDPQHDPAPQDEGAEAPMPDLNLRAEDASKGIEEHPLMLGWTTEAMDANSRIEEIPPKLDRKPTATDER